MAITTPSQATRVISRIAPFQKSGVNANRSIVRVCAGYAVWLPLVLGVVHFGLFLVKLPAFLHRLYWDSDGAVAAVLAQTTGHGTMILGHYGWYTTLGLMLSTRWLPFHHQLWEYAPFGIYLLTMALLSWVSLRTAGRWAAAMTATLAVATSPFFAYVAVSLNFHTNAWAGTAVAGAFCFWLSREQSQSRAAIATLAMTLYLGVMLASDPLLAFTAIAPLALVGLVVAAVRDHRLVGFSMLVVGIVSVPVALLTGLVMHEFNIVIWQAPAHLAAMSDVPAHFHNLIQLIIQLANGNYYENGSPGLRSKLSFACAGLVLLSTLMPLAVIRRSFHGRQVSVPLLAYSTFWASSVLINCAAYVFSTTGSQPGYYVISVYYAAIATIPIAFATTTVRQAIGAVAVGVLALTSFLNLIDNKTALYGGLPEAASVTPQILAVAEREHATKGYADYWDAPSMTWTTGMKLHVEQVSECQTPSGMDLCPFAVNANTSWFDPSPTKSFVLQDADSMSMEKPPPVSLGRPESVYRIGKAFTMYIYPDDIATKINYANTNWKRP